ncbi:MAG: hypothetical protein NUW23_13825 [Firmicutes bacterium]|nr:hypothetical protein [Bacillota bacterium]
MVDANGVTVGFIGPDDLPREDIVFDYERDCYVYLSDAMERLSPTRAWEIFAGGRSVAEFIQESGENTPEDAVWAYVGVKGNQVNPLFETAAHARAVGEKLIAHMKMTLESQAGR